LNTPVHFHCQITASALPAGSGGGASDSLLFQSVPDLDNVRRFTEAAPGEMDLSIRAVGEMLPNMATNSVTVPFQPPDNDEFNVPRALVTVTPGPEDTQLQSLMDGVIQAIAQQVFGVPPLNPSAIVLDGLGTTYHESGTLRMGDDPTQSVVNADGQF